MAIPQLRIEIIWRAVLANEQPDVGYEYPQNYTELFRRRYSAPAVYRWRIHPADNGRREAVYVGEADNLAQRVQRVRTPSQTGTGGQTIRRLKEIFDEAIQNGKHVFLDIADFEPFELNSVLITRDSLDDKFRRCLIENLCLCTFEKEGYELLNKRLEPQNEAEKRFRSLPPSEKRRFLKILSDRNGAAAQD